VKQHPDQRGAVPDDNDRPGSSSAGIVSHAIDTYRDLARDLVAELVAADEHEPICDCDDEYGDYCECEWASRIRRLAGDARRRLWLIEIEDSRRRQIDGQTTIEGGRSS
jgi:hypothetical protein